ncbi:MAG: PAS domain-containing protein [Eggerthella lenta]
MPGGYHRCLDAPGCDFLYMSDRFLDMFGYTREEIKELFDDKYMLMVHPDDRDSVAKGVTALREGTAGSDPLEYRMRAKDGWRWVIDQSRFLEYDDTSFLQGVVVDVTETVELRDMMSMLIEHTSSDIVLLSWSDKEDVRVNVVACGASKKYGLSPEQYEDIIRGQLYLPSGDGGGRLVDEIVDKIDRGESLAIVDRPRFPGHENVWMHVEARRVGLESSERIVVPGHRCDYHEEPATGAVAIKRKLEGLLDQAGQSWDWDINSNRLVLRAASLWIVYSQV